MPAAIGVFGGTFDPIHIGHLVAASEVASVLALDSVIFVPAGQPWQKSDRTVSDARHRLAMVELAIAGNHRFSVSDVDVVRDGPTYAIDTISDLAEQYPDTQFHWISGSDAVNGMTSWHRWEEFIQRVNIVVVNRAGVPIETPFSVKHVEMPDLRISASDLRSRFALGKTAKYLIPDSVLEYIESHKLYR